MPPVTSHSMNGDIVIAGDRCHATKFWCRDFISIEIVPLLLVRAVGSVGNVSDWESIDFR